MIGRARSRFCLALASLLLASPAVPADQRPDRPRYVPKLQRQGDVVRHPTWGVEVTIPNFEYWKDNSMQVQPNYVLGAQAKGDCELNLTMFVENDKDDVTPVECRAGYRGNPEKLRKDHDVHRLEESAAPVPYALFDQTWSSSGVSMTQNQLYGYWTRGNLCFELHISAVLCERAAFAHQAMPILQSVKIGPDTGATLETVGLALEGGPDPLGWESHMLVGGLYLHKVKPPDHAKSRRFYEDALRLGGGAIPPFALYNIEAGIGIDLLEGNDGAAAAPYLESALAAAHGIADTVPGEIPHPSRQATIEEVLHNLICAQSLAGNTEAACIRARELLTPMDADHRRAKVKALRKDKQTRAMIKSDCYARLLTDLGLD